jgi:hypothetical protein
MVHHDAVDAWMSRAASARSADALLRSFDTALAGIWTQAIRTLGPITLDAIADRVFTNVAERFPFLNALADRSGKFRRDGFQFQARLGAIGYEDLARAVRAVLVDLLALLGSLTADILTPRLHAELVREPVYSMDPWVRAAGAAR